MDGLKRLTLPCAQRTGVASQQLLRLLLFSYCDNDAFVYFPRQLLPYLSVFNKGLCPFCSTLTNLWPSSEWTPHMCRADACDR